MKKEKAEKQLKTWEGVNKYLTKDAKNALKGNSESKKDDVIIDDKKDEKGKLSYTDIKDMPKERQIKVLKDLGLDDAQIKMLSIEEKRIKKILKLQK